MPGASIKGRTREIRIGGAGAGIGTKQEDQVFFPHWAEAWIGRGPDFASFSDAHPHGHRFRQFPSPEVLALLPGTARSTTLFRPKNWGVRPSCRFLLG